MVQEVKGEMALVRLGDSLACGACRRCGLAQTGSRGEVWAVNRLGAEVGSPVTLAMGGRGFLEGAFLAYILPLLGAAAGYFLGANLVDKTVGIWGGLAGFGGSLLFLRFWTIRFPGEPWKVVAAGERNGWDEGKSVNKCM